MRKVFIPMALLLLPLNVNAVDATPWTKISRIESRNNNVHDIYVESPIPTQNCSYNDRGLVDVSTDGGKVMMSVALSALMAGKDVVVKVDGCLGYAPKIVTILVRP